MELAALDLDFDEVSDFKPVLRSALNSCQSFSQVIANTQINEVLEGFSEAKKLLIFLAFLEASADYDFKLEVLKLASNFLLQIQIDGLTNEKFSTRFGEGDFFLCCKSALLVSSSNQVIKSNIDTSDILEIFLAYLAGCISAALNITLQHLKIREQFSKPIGSFQLVQEHTVSCFNVFEIIRSHIMLFDKLSHKSLVYSKLLHFLQNVGLGEIDRLVQACGGIGFTKEFRLHKFLNRFRKLVFLVG